MTDIKRKNRLLYIFEAALEYFVTISVSGAYLAYLTTALKIPDALTGVLTSFVSLGCVFQILSTFLKGDAKKNTVIFHLINELSFVLLYFSPFLPFGDTFKAIIFTVFLFIGFALNNLINPLKTEWYMQSVDMDKRGVFTANKEIVSLVFGMIYSLLLGYIFDLFKAKGDTEGALFTVGIILFTVTAAHSVVMAISERTYGEILTKDGSDKTKVKNKRQAIKKLLKEKNFIKVVAMIMLWRAVMYSTVPFFGTYQIKELGFSMTFVSVLTVIYAIVRAVFERPLGKIADKKGFAVMLNVCYGAEIAALAVAVFIRPVNGRILYTVYYILHAICCAGISSGELNIVYDYVKQEERTAALAIKSAVAGISGFLSTLILSPVVSAIQKHGFKLFGVNVYAQQVTSFIGLVSAIALVVYNVVVIQKIERRI